MELRKGVLARGKVCVVFFLLVPLIISQLALVAGDKDRAGLAAGLHSQASFFFFISCKLTNNAFGSAAF